MRPQKAVNFRGRQILSLVFFREDGDGMGLYQFRTNDPSDYSDL